ncbi:hypothetical protein LSH36_1151g00028 [Paralvinella palmiformis]|uniref:Ig-like domain-containing protein n=1 Tax=Paralvinella palmiformis TaxID=53620 RepID=A0AAD9MS94_9ANNE|nr:hypothetical protein LSH36_1151g00028 [Paralvinella palmiformis]
MSVKGPIVEEENPNIILTCSVDDPGRYNAKFLWIKDNVEQCVHLFPAKANISTSLPRTATAIADPKDSFNVTCSFESKPAATISWTYNNNNNSILPSGVVIQPVTTTPSGKKSIVSQTLLWNPSTYVSSRRSAGGVFLCKGTVDLGKGRFDTKESQMVLNVEYAPYQIEFNESDSITAVADVDNITIACTANYGLTVHVNLTIFICLTTNPFIQLIGSNWKLKSSENANTVNGLANGLVTRFQDSNSPFKECVIFIIA